MVKKTSHHHGDLREALISAGMQLVREGGPDALTIRGVAAKAGVSHAAPKHHFPTLVHLRTAVATKAHRDFAEALEAGIAEADAGDARARMVGACVGYLRFARAYSGLFQLMFGMTGLDHEDTALKAAAARSYGVLAQVCSAVAPGPAGARGTEILVWSLAHGFSSLALLGEFEDAPLKTLEIWLDQIFPNLPLAGESTAPDN